MDSEALRTFVTIHASGGFSAAADVLGRSQPAISRRIALLEGELGGPVFERTAAGIRLSLMGEALLPHAERVLGALADARRAVREVRELDAGPVALAAVGTLAGPALTDILREFARAAPGAAFSLRTATSSQVSELVRSGEAALGLRYFDDRSPDLESYPAAPERLIVVCAPEHRLAGRRVASLTELAEEPWLAFPRRHEGGEIVAETLFSQFLLRGVAAFRWSAIDSLTAQKRMVEAGFGIGLLSESGIAEEIGAGSLAVIGVDDLAAANPVFVIRRRNGYLGSAALRLLNLLTAKPA